MRRRNNDNFEEIEEDLDSSEDSSFDDDIDLDSSEVNENQEDNTEEDIYQDDLFNEDLSFGDFGSGPAPMEKHSELLKGLTDFGPFMREKVNGWLGLTWDEDQKKYVRDPQNEPIMNKKCASWCIDYLRNYARSNNIITNIGKQEYINLVDDIIDVLWFNLALRAEEFNLKDSGDILRVCTEMQHTAELVLMGAGDGKYNELLTKTTHRNESISGQQQFGYNGPQYAQPKSRTEKFVNWLGGK